MCIFHCPGVVTAVGSTGSFLHHHPLLVIVCAASSATWPVWSDLRRVRQLLKPSPSHDCSKFTAEMWEHADVAKERLWAGKHEQVVN